MRRRSAARASAPRTSREKLGDKNEYANGGAQHAPTTPCRKLITEQPSLACTLPSWPGFPGSEFHSAFGLSRAHRSQVHGLRAELERGRRPCRATTRASHVLAMALVSTPRRRTSVEALESTRLMRLSQTLCVLVTSRDARQTLDKQSLAGCPRRVACGAVAGGPARGAEALIRQRGAGAGIWGVRLVLALIYDIAHCCGGTGCHGQCHSQFGVELGGLRALASPDPARTCTSRGERTAISTPGRGQKAWRLPGDCPAATH